MLIATSVQIVEIYVADNSPCLDSDNGVVNKDEHTPWLIGTLDSNHSLVYLEIVLPLILNLPYNVI